MQNPKGRLYKKGARYERAIVNNARRSGKLSFRSAGSKSAIDVVIIDSEKKTISLIQAKAGKALSRSIKHALEDKYRNLNGTYEVKFIVQ